MKLNLMKTLKTMMLAGCGMLLLSTVGCDKAIKTVKNGTMQMRPDATLEAIMNYRFADGEWSSEEEAGRKIVCFQGKIRKELHDFAVQTICYGIVSENAYRQVRDERIEKLDPQKRVINKKSAEREQALIAKCKKSTDQEEIEKIRDEINKLSSDSFQQCIELDEKDKQMFMDEFKAKFWKTGSPVEIKWTVYPDGERFELISLANESWDKCVDTATVLELIFAK